MLVISRRIPSPRMTECLPAQIMPEDCTISSPASLITRGINEEHDTDPINHPKRMPRPKASHSARPRFSPFPLCPRKRTESASRSAPCSRAVPGRSRSPAGHNSKPHGQESEDDGDEEEEEEEEEEEKEKKCIVCFLKDRRGFRAYSNSTSTSCPERQHGSGTT